VTRQQTKFNEEANEVYALPNGEPAAEALPTGRQRKSYFQKAPEKPSTPKQGKAPRRQTLGAGRSLSARGACRSNIQESPASSQAPMTARDKGYSSLTQGFIEPEPTSSEVCKDLDSFEAGYEPVARLGNFFSAPKKPRASPSQATVPAPSAVDNTSSGSSDQAMQATGLSSTGDQGLGLTMPAATDGNAAFGHAEAS